MVEDNLFISIVFSVIRATLYILYNKNIYKELAMMTKVFQSGNSQAVRIPASFRLNVDTVEILHGENGDIILRPFKPKADLDFLALFDDIDESFIEALENRDIAPPQEREEL